MMDLKQLIIGKATDAAADFAFYDRKEDETLSVEQLQQAIDSGVITKDEIAAAFRAGLD